MNTFLLVIAVLAVCFGSFVLGCLHERRIALHAMGIMRRMVHTAMQDLMVSQQVREFDAHVEAGGVPCHRC